MKNTKNSEYFTIHYEDKDQLLVKEAEGALNENLRRLMAFFNLSALSGKSAGNLAQKMYRLRKELKNELERNGITI